MSEQGRAKLLQVFRYVQAFNYLQNPLQREIQQQHILLWFHELPEHPCIIFGRRRDGGDDNQAALVRQGENDGDEDDFILKVRRPKLTEAPAPPKEIARWIRPGWQQIDGSIEIDAEGAELLQKQPRYQQALKMWSEQREAWVEVEWPQRQVMTIFERFVGLRAQFARDAERQELVLGDGLVRWYARDNQIIQHPVLLLQLQLVYDPQIPAFTLKETEHAPELYTALFQGMEEVNASDLRQIREDFERQRRHPLGGEETTRFLQRFLHQIAPKGEMLAGQDGVRNALRPTIKREPVIFLRSRMLGFNTALEAILEDLPKRRQLPSSLTSLLGIGAKDTTFFREGRPQRPGLGTVNGEDDHILLSKPANAEQLEIARQLEHNKAVLVQGPPGTGKTHTIANLLGHLLAQGKSVLVTSHTSKALRVLQQKVVEPLQPLCVSLLEDDSRKQMEGAIEAITDRLSRSRGQVLQREVAALAQQRKKILEELEGKRALLRDARNSEYEAIVIAGEQYSPSKAAQYVHKYRETASWIPGPLVAGTPLPLSEEQIGRLYSTNGTVTSEDEREIVQGLLDVSQLPTPATFAELVTQQAALDPGELRYRHELWARNTAAFATDVLQTLQEEIAGIPRFLKSFGRWQLAAIDAGREGGLYRQPWDELIREIKNVEMLALRSQASSITYDPVFAEQYSRAKAGPILDEIIAYLDKGKKLNALILGLHREWRGLIEHTRVQGRAAETREQFLALRDRLALDVARETLIGRWQRQMVPLGAPSAQEVRIAPEQAFKHYLEQLPMYLEWYARTWLPLEQRLRQQGLQWEGVLKEVAVPLVEYGKLYQLVTILEAYLPRILEAEIKRRQQLGTEQRLKGFRQQLAQLTSAERTTPVVQRIVMALERRDVQGYTEVYERVAHLYRKQDGLQQRQALLRTLEKSAPRWASAIRSREGVHGRQEMPGDPTRAWLWRQLNDELERRARLSLEEIQEEIENLSRTLQRVTAELVEKKTWMMQVQRTTPEQWQALQGWKILMSKIGKGTGKRAPNQRAEARKLMHVCQTAVPVWIMPLSRVVETFDPRHNHFDVVIIDEASQADIKALVVLYMGEQVLVVGDDEQVTPLAVGQEIGKVDKLIEEHLQHIPNATLYTEKLSIYELAKTGFQPICLLEHFRCVPSIIQFSNHLSYNGKIKPLREEGSTHCQPPTIAYRVKSGGIKNDVNQEEASTIASLLVAACELPEYKDATFGVISLLKEAQALAIDVLLNSYLAPTEYTRRRILCGIPAQFQGDERDVIFLSLVDTPKEGGGPLALRGEEAYEHRDKKRFNVAASRARDQLWVVHSLDPELDLKDGDLRRRLILHAANPQAFARDLVEGEKKTESEFEKQVMKMLVQKGYRVVPQWKVGAYRIDLVVEGAGRRLAVECDGDRWHPMEKLEEDMARQALLERLGWRFARIRGSQFFRNPEQAMEPVFARLEALEIPAEGAVSRAHSMDEKGEDLKRRIIQRAAELRQEWQAKEDTGFHRAVMGGTTGQIQRKVSFKTPS